MLNDNIKTLRKKMGLTQVELAERLNVSQSTITSWENGTRRPDLDFLPVLAQIFGISVDDLLGTTTDTVVKTDPWAVESACFEPSTPEEYRLLSGFRSLNEAGQQFILQTLDTAVASNIYKQSDLSLGKEAK